ncbi:MAG TPA: carbamoyl phosphate synthase small subunit, partial [Candidatus Melainabacteria bacterium]|nr:carbamoyl phosphate synthase small subunit [Candidatus Melainabacteria bacterium]
VEITSQNHGFAVDENGFPDSLDVTHINLNDKSIEGFKHKHLPIFAVQYHPEASPGPHDSNYLFEQFFHLIDTTQLARV